MESTNGLDDFLDALAAGDPTPGGGSAAALAGALGAALAAMVGKLTVGRKRFAAVEAQMQSIVAEADALRHHLTLLIADDADAYEQVRMAYRLSKDDAARQTAIQEALKAATQTPLETAQACLAALRLVEQAAKVGNPNAITDAAVGALLAHAGLVGALLNVRTNLGGLDDPDFVAEYQRASSQVKQEAEFLLGSTLAEVEQRL